MRRREETSFVEPNAPGITTVAMAPDATLPTTELFDTAKVSPVTGNLDTAVANVDFRLYGPGDTNCTGEPVFVSLNRPVTVVADGQSFYATAESAHYNALLAGKYRWTAHFDGDANNADADSLCNATNEDSTVEKASPSVVTDIDDEAPGASVVLGQEGTEITDTATLSGATANVTGNIVFKLYRSATTPVGNSGYCDDATPVTTVTVPIEAGKTTYQASYTVKEIGWYNWTAQYVPAGDPNNNASAVHGCGVEAETLNVTPRQPEITTEVPDTSVVLGVEGTDLTDTATLSGGTTDPAIGGTITFTLYGPFGPEEEPSCTEGTSTTRTTTRTPWMWTPATVTTTPRQ